MPPFPPDRVVSIREAAKRLNVTTRTVYRMIGRGELTAIPTKPHRGMAVTLASVERLLATLAPAS